LNSTPTALAVIRTALVLAVPKLSLFHLEKNLFIVEKNLAAF